MLRSKAPAILHFVPLAIALLVPSWTALSAPHSRDPELPRTFTFALFDVCLPFLEGHLSLRQESEQSKKLRLFKVEQVPPYLRPVYRDTTTWFSPEANRKSIYVGQKGDRAVCRVVLADSIQTLEVQAFVQASLQATQFVRMVVPGQIDQGFNESMWAMHKGDSVFVVLMEGPRVVLREGDGEQAMVSIAIYSKAEFEATAAGRR